MDLNEQLQTMKRQRQMVPREEKIQETIQKAKDNWLDMEQNRFVTYWEFLWGQFRYTRKRWWGFQGGLLLLGCKLIPALADQYHRVRSLGVIGCLFVVLMIPELWRNREADSMQVEAACLYSLQQIYAARISLFGMVDVVFLSLFGMSLGTMGFTWMEVMSQFLLPVTVTACICFSFLCGKSNFGETVSLTACLVWGGLWWLVLMNEEMYREIVPSVWAVLFAIAVGFLVLAVRKTVQKANQYWEVDFA